MLLKISSSALLNGLFRKKKCTINAFVIMPNHIHMLWKISDGFERKDVQGALFSFTAHEFKRHLKKKDAVHLQKYFVNSSDRDYQFWEREPMVKECWTEKFFRQKLNYIHFNPCQQHWNLATSPEEYKWSSARFYETGIKNFSWLSHFNDCWMLAGTGNYIRVRPWKVKVFLINTSFF